MSNRTKEEDRIYQAKWRDKNREKTRESSLKHYYKIKDTPGWKEQHSARYKKWVAANPVGNYERNRKYRKAKPERFAIYEIRKRYKVSLEEAAILLAQRKKGCEICNSETAGVIDHSHETGKVRGILCNGCNKVLGHAFENPAILRALADYLEKHS